MVSRRKAVELQKEGDKDVAIRISLRKKRSHFVKQIPEPEVRSIGLVETAENAGPTVERDRVNGIFDILYKKREIGFKHRHWTWSKTITTFEC